MIIKGTVVDRLAARTERVGDCLVWTGCRDRDGYGWITINYEQLYVHRVAWALKHGPIPDGMQVLHACDNPPCLNTAHLFLGTNLDNIADKVAKGRSRNQNQNKTHCPAGHPYDRDNTYLDPTRHARHCRACMRQRSRPRRRRRPE